MPRYISLRGFLRIFLTGLAGLAACGGAMGQTGSSSAKTNQSPSTANAAQTTEDKVFTLVGAGDIAGCGAALAGAEATAKLIESIPGEVFASGDLAYEHGN